MKSLFMLSAVSGVMAANMGVNPITRVAELLQGLSKKIEEDGKAEAKLFKAYQCWYKQTTAEKTQSNAEAAARIETLTTFIDDVENGRIEFTSERQDLEKELSEIIAQMEKARDLRAQEKADFEAAKDEMTKAINALTEAVSILGEGAPVEGSFLARRFTQRKALELAKTELSTADFRFLERALDSQPAPKDKDWNKLNKDATFKQKYKARSGEIQTTLKNMLQTFEDNLSDAEKKETDAQDAYDKLTAAKQDQRDATEKSLLDMNKENGARGMSLEEAKTEKSNLETQVSNDEKYIKEVQAAYDTKMGEFKERKRLRTEEVASISEAIGILRSDDARDLFKKSFESQGYFFVQTGSQQNNARVQKALALVFESVKKSGADAREMARVTARLSRAVEGVGEVITAIDEMLAELATEAENDLTWKEECEEFVMDNQKEALKHSREMDDQTALIARKVARMEELTEKIAVANKEIADIEAQLEEAKKLREDENREYKSAKADDKAAVELIEMAIGALEKFYKDNNLLQVTQGPGEAPAPPPPTFEGAYGGEKDEHQGVVGILTLIKEDVEKDIRTADAEEEKSEKAYQEFKTESEDKIAGLQDQITSYEGAHAKAETAKADAETAHKSAEEMLTSVMDKLKAKDADCDFIAVNFPVRKDNRQKEVDGLHKAKTILEGGAF